MDSSSRTKAVAIGVAVVAVVAVAVYAFLRPSEGWPDESRRFVHPAGFSVVAPEDYEQESHKAAGPSGNSLRMLSKSRVGNPSLVEVSQIAPADVAGLTAKQFTPATFQSKPAWERRRDLPKTHEHSRTLVFERDGQWYQFAVRAGEADSLDSGAWAAYFDSFRSEPRKATPPDFVHGLVAPTTAPAAATAPTAARP